MAVLDDLSKAAQDAVSAGAAAVRQQGTALKGDFEVLLKPNLDAILAQVASIAADRIAGNIGDDQARDDLKTQFDSVRTLIVAEAELAALAVQVIITAVINALKSVINAATQRAIGIALL